MLSILIPVYNFKVEKLVRALMRQCKKLDIDYEILCFDDGSRPAIRRENAILSGFFGVNYTELSENLGRARIRNWMARSASFERLLFLDCDSKIIRKDFIRKYLEAASTGEIVCGGRLYGRKPPRARSKRLHWKYGRKKETRSLRKRQKHPWLYFHSNNFLVQRRIVMDHGFDERHRGYGYEDLLWARELVEAGYRIAHIDNPVEHLGLEKATSFLRKAREAAANLARIRQRYPAFRTPLTQLAGRLMDYGLRQSFMDWYRPRAVRHADQLENNDTSLLKLSLLKLFWYLEALQEN